MTLRTTADGKEVAIPSQEDSDEKSSLGPTVRVVGEVRSRGSSASAKKFSQARYHPALEGAYVPIPHSPIQSGSSHSNLTSILTNLKAKTIDGERFY
jgi:hypothetical protein